MKREAPPVVAETPRSSVPQEKPLPVIRREITPDQICVLTFDRSGSSANVFDRAALEELDSDLDFIAGSPTLRGVVLASAKNSIFVAGADLHAMAHASSDELHRLIELGQSVFNRLASLQIPTVAAIHGACVGGGCEIALACDYRIATPDRVTRIGLPETQLGILPAWGGSTRLPRLIGLPRALDVILGGKTLAAKQALRYGMVDDLAPRERLVDLACRKILSEGLNLRRRRHPLKLMATNNVLVANLISLRVQSQLMKKTCGHYPALFKALEVARKGVSRSVEASLKLERDAILELAPTEECRNLIRVFFMQEHAKKLGYLVENADARPKPVAR
ncbi:MAG TPA: enoyl-CoA hydratase-related protein, partial [Verrucomicrobiae bacterium]|nr:enoyl-CoA hydratase-related protein [Verrucomicrobiae bacterium]